MLPLVLATMPDVIYISTKFLIYFCTILQSCHTHNHDATNDTFFLYLDIRTSHMLHCILTTPSHNTLQPCYIHLLATLPHYTLIIINIIYVIFSVDLLKSTTKLIIIYLFCGVFVFLKNPYLWTVATSVLPHSLMV